MEAVAKALLTAKEEVFITDWWLSPEVMLIRPADDETSRLDNLLGKIAVSFRFVFQFIIILSFVINRTQEFAFISWYLRRCLSL